MEGLLVLFFQFTPVAVYTLWSIRCIVRLLKNAQFYWAALSIIAFATIFATGMRHILGYVEGVRVFTLYLDAIGALFFSAVGALFFASLGLMVRKETQIVGIFALILNYS